MRNNFFYCRGLKVIISNEIKNFIGLSKGQDPMRYNVGDTRASSAEQKKTKKSRFSMGSEDNMIESAPLPTSQRFRIDVSESVHARLHDFQLQMKYNVHTAGTLIEALLMATGDIVDPVQVNE